MGLQPILSNQQLLKLKEHKYSCINHSFLDQYMNPFWIWLELKVPVSIHANTLTLAGLVVNVITTLVLVYYSPNAKTAAPAWTYLCCCLGIFTYQTLDAMDGKHARRTNTSSPLGELFDHGCDSLSTLFVVIGMCICLKLGEAPLWMAFFVASSMGLYYLAHWQTYVTGSLQFGKFDVTELQFVCMAGHTMSAFLGPDVWLIAIPGTTYNIRTVIYIWMLFSVSMAAWMKFVIILNGGPGRNGSAVGNMSIISPLFPALVVAWMSYYVYAPFTDNYMVFLFAFGIISSKVTNRLVIAHMSQTEMRLWDTAYLIPLIMIARDYFNVWKWIPESLLLWVCLVHASLDLLFYCIRICIEIRNYLGIRVFSVVPLPLAGSTKNPIGTSQLQKRPLPARINTGKEGSVRIPLSPSQRPLS